MYCLFFVLYFRNRIAQTNTDIFSLPNFFDEEVNIAGLQKKGLNMSAVWIKE